MQIKSPANVVGATFFPVATRALFIMNIMIICKAIAANYFKRTHIGGATGMVSNTGSLMAGSVGAGEV
jgi:hypothetical protein